MKFLNSPTPLSQRAGNSMVLLVDSREQRPYPFTRFADVQTEEATLPVGDYSLPGFEDRVSIERKSLDDLIACLQGANRERFQRELAKLRFYDLAAVVVEASLEDISRGRYRSEMKPHAALQSIFTFQVRYRAHFIFAGGREAAEYVTFSLLSKFREEIRKRFDRAFKAGKEQLHEIIG